MLQRYGISVPAWSFDQNTLSKPVVIKKAVSSFAAYIEGPFQNAFQARDIVPDNEFYEEFIEGYIARNPKNHDDLWYVAKKYFDENLEEA